jgi:hypothetical protein
MATYVITHEVEDVDRWISSPKRAEAFSKIDATVREFRDPEGSNKTPSRSSSRATTRRRR